MPNTAYEIKTDVIYAFVADANTNTYPSAAVNKGSMPKKVPIVIPNVAPIENSGVTSPPWNPIEIQKVVANNFKIKS